MLKVWDGSFLRTDSDLEMCLSLAHRHADGCVLLSLVLSL